MANENCLEGFACPNCASDERFAIECVTLVTVDDDGIDSDTCSNFEWDHDSYCECLACGHKGTVFNFRTE